MIRQGQLRPGDRLPSERDLSEQLHVSRASLREALRALEIAGIVTSRQGGGTRIREVFDDGILSPLSLVLDASTDLVGDLWEVRSIFEPAVASRAATTMIRSFVWGVSATDPLTYTSVAVLIVTIATIASVIPALRILRIDPAIVLRQE